MTWTEMKKCGTIGRQVCNSDIKLTEAKVEFETDNIDTDTSFFDFKDMNRADRQVFSQRFRITIGTYVLNSKKYLASGSFGSVYLFQDDAKKFKCAVKIMFVPKKESWYTSQTVFDCDPKNTKQQKEYKEIQEIHEKLDCAVNLSVMFSTKFIRNKYYKTAKMSVVLMESIEFDLQDYCEKIVYTLDKERQVDAVYTILKSLITNYICISKVYTVFPDMKPANLAVSCTTPNPLSVVYIDTDGILTLRSKNGPFSRTENTETNGKIDCENKQFLHTTYRSDEIEPTRTFYDENIMIVMGFFPLIVTIANIIGVAFSYDNSNGKQHLVYEVVDKLGQVHNDWAGPYRYKSYREHTFTECLVYLEKKFNAISNINFLPDSNKKAECLKHLIKELAEICKKSSESGFCYGVKGGLTNPVRMKTMEMWQYVIDDAKALLQCLEIK